MANVDRHVNNVRRFGFEPVIAINVFNRDTEEELAAIESACATRKLAVARSNGYARGGEGTVHLAELVEAAAARPTPAPRFLYPEEARPPRRSAPSPPSSTARRTSPLVSRR